MFLQLQSLPSSRSLPQKWFPRFGKKLLLSDQVGAHVLGQCLQGPLEAGGRRGPDELMLGIPGDAGTVGWAGKRALHTSVLCVRHCGAGFFFFFLIHLFLVLAVLGLCCCTGFFYLWQARATLCGVRASHCCNFSCGAWVLGHADFSGCSTWALERRLRSCGARVQLLCSMWNLP